MLRPLQDESKHCRAEQEQTAKEKGATEKAAKDNAMIYAASLISSSLRGGMVKRSRQVVRNDTVVGRTLGQYYSEHYLATGYLTEEILGWLPPFLLSKKYISEVDMGRTLVRLGTIARGPYVLVRSWMRSRVIIRSRWLPRMVDQWFSKVMEPVPLEYVEWSFDISDRSDDMQGLISWGPCVFACGSGFRFI